MEENKEIWDRNQYLRQWGGKNVKNTINQLRKKEQRKRYNAVVAVKRQK